MDKKEPNLRISINVDEEMYKQIEDFRFENRYQTRTEAIVALLEKGIEELKKEIADGGK